MMESFIINAVLGGVAVATISGILGSIVLWKKMSYFGDALSHSALLGVTIGFLFNYNLTLSVVVIAILFALCYSRNKFIYSNDTILGILSYTALSLAIIIASYSKIKIDLMSYLFGDILVVNDIDIMLLMICLIITLVWVSSNWSKIVLYSISEDLLYAERVKVEKIKLSFVIILALFVAISFKIVGMLLVTATLIIPPASALPISKSPKQMVIYSILIGSLSVILGIAGAFYVNCPTGASIILTSSLFLLITNTYKYFRSLA